MPFKFISPAPQVPYIDVVFIHGLKVPKFGRKTQWGGPPPSEFYWPEWINTDVPTSRVGILTYRSDALRFDDKGLHIEDQALALLADLATAGIGERPVVFIAHSLGGLLVKELLLRSRYETNAQQLIAAACRGVVFIATPHYGSAIARIASEAFPSNATELLKSLSDEDRHIVHLSARYSQWVSCVPQMQHVVFAEGRKTHGFQIVDARSADPGIGNAKFKTIDADHNEIALPANRESPLYVGILALLRTTSVSKVLSARIGTVTPGTDPALRSLVKESFKTTEKQMLELLEKRDEIRLTNYGPDPYPHLLNADELSLKRIETKLKEVRALLSNIPEDIELEVRREEIAAKQDKSIADAKRAAELSAAWD